MTCRAIANRMAEMAGGQAGWDQLAEGMACRDAVASTDAVSAVEQAESNKGNNGVPWVGGGSAGGAGQSSIKVVGDVTRAGLQPAQRPQRHRYVVARAWRLRQPPDLPDVVIAWRGRGLCEPRAGRTRATHLRKLHEGQTTPGVGHAGDPGRVRNQAAGVAGTGIGARPTTPTNLDAAGSSSLPITRGVIEALRDEPDQDVLGKRLASEAALSSDAGEGLCCCNAPC